MKAEAEGGNAGIFFCTKDGETTVAYAGDSFLVSEPIPIELARRNVYILATEMSLDEPVSDNDIAESGLWSVGLYYGKWPLRRHDELYTCCNGLSKHEKAKFIGYLQENLESGNFDDAIRTAVTYTHLAPGQKLIC